MSSLLALTSMASAATGNSAKDYVDLDRAKFQKEVDGKPVDLFTIKNKKGMVVKITNYGARVEQILVPDKHGKLGDVVLGYESIDQVMNGQGSMNAFIGRYANRIAKGKFVLNGQEYQLNINNPPNTLHGGLKGSRFVVFDAHQIDDSSVEMSYTYKDGEENFPGTLPSKVTYKVTNANALDISYEAVAVDKPTIVNFTSHLFVNLAGSGDILDHVLTIPADKITPVDETLITTGEFRPVKGTPMDFTKPEKIGARITADYDQIKYGPGYDVNYVLNKKGQELSLAARVADPKSGRVLEILSTEPGIQFYSGNFLEGKAPRDVGKGGQVYNVHGAFSLEPQHFPDGVNKPNFPSTVLNPGEWYKGKIVYKFGVQK
ncbi:aldose epimerase family protein [Telmatospirillum sp.]|uniref:aldose epimerase family protein n=1 Tax=Telmatospirillum sp. TaxID=2079197 RepID=UPI0028519472|nr:aldose epimerase family protein [Telmatospirillum sp.]MDR3440820.1 galactose mutarotase [Telmatospirillum sp.]